MVDKNEAFMDAAFMYFHFHFGCDVDKSAA
jgi:hypothetical protein